MLTRTETERLPATRTRRPGRRLEAILGLGVLPIGLAVGLGVAIRRLLRKRKPLTEKPALALAERADRLEDVHTFALETERTDLHPRMGFGLMDFEMVYAPDLIPSILDNYPKYANRFFQCPPPFRRVTVESFDGTPIFAEVAARDDRERPGLVVAHGIFGSTSQSIYARAAIEAFTHWGFNAILVDLRGWGRSAALSTAPITGGWKESEDVLSAAKYLLENTRTTTVGGMGYSLGGASMMLAAAHPRAPELLASGVLSESGFSDAREVMRIMERNPGVLSRQYIIYWIFRLGFTRKLRALGHRGFTIIDYLERVSAPYYGVTTQELYERSSPLRFVSEIKVPALQLHAEDDWVVPVEHALALRRAATEERNDRIGVCIKPRGSHCAFARVDGAWRSELVRRYFSATSGVVLR